ncbi:MAG: hypothetical protein M1831_003172 [Alyxoria varia]|nr:MAG: hypothetical protein M1831_003172 [Alyxoria varia]
MTIIEDSRAIHAITITTLILLPVTALAGIFSPSPTSPTTSSSPSVTSEIHITLDFYMFWAVVTPLTCPFLLLWRLAIAVAEERAVSGVDVRESLGVLAGRAVGSLGWRRPAVGGDEGSVDAWRGSGLHGDSTGDGTGDVEKQQIQLLQPEGIVPIYRHVSGLGPRRAAQPHEANVVPIQPCSPCAAFTATPPIRLGHPKVFRQQSPESRLAARAAGAARRGKGGPDQETKLGNRRLKAFPLVCAWSVRGLGQKRDAR